MTIMGLDKVVLGSFTPAVKEGLVTARSRPTLKSATHSHIRLFVFLPMFLFCASFILLPRWFLGKIAVPLGHNLVSLSLNPMPLSFSFFLASCRPRGPDVVFHLTFLLPLASLPPRLPACIQSSFLNSILTGCYLDICLCTSTA